MTVALNVLSATPSQPPHVLVIYADQCRLDCLEAFGNRQVKTPHLSALAADGVRFTNSFCAFPACTPSRYSLLSGLPVHAHRGWDNRSTLAPSTPTFASLLRQAGYATKAVGKMHFTPTYLDLGFSELELAEQDGPGRWDDDYHRYLRKLGLVDANDLEDQRAEYRKEARPVYWQTFGALPSNLTEQHYSTTWIGDRTVETLKKWTVASPALLMVGFIKPHHPFDPPEPWAHMYDPNTISPLPGWLPQNLPVDGSKGYFPHEGLTLPALQRCAAYYYAAISQMDHHVGRMIQILKERKLYDSTLIIFTADHGEYLGFHHLLLKGNHMYDPLAKVPLIVKFPHQRAAGSVRGNLVNTIDVAPTILKAAGVNPPAAMKGLDLSDPAARREVVFCETRPQVMARTETRKLIYYTANPSRSLFFDLVSDPLELTNRYAEATCQREISNLVRAVETWRPARLPDRYVDEQAPVIAQPNVPSRTDNHREEISAWYAQQMQSLAARANRHK